MSSRHPSPGRQAPAGRWWCMGVAITVLLGANWIRVGHAQPPLADRRSQPTAGVLVLLDGRVVEGIIQETRQGYLVEKPNGNVLVPFKQIRLKAADRREAYRKLREGFPQHSAASHVALARWCLLQQLHELARDELRAALKLDPGRSEAQSMLRDLEDILPSETPQGQPPTRTPDGFQVPEIRSLAGLSRPAARQFVSRIQPLLINTCGNAACHGPGVANRFRLKHSRIGRGHRLSTEHNLAATLKYIHINDPLASPLLTIPETGHGSDGRDAFYGRNAQEQLKILREWVSTVSNEQRRRQERQQASPSIVAEKRPGDVPTAASPTGAVVPWAISPEKESFAPIAGPAAPAPISAPDQTDTPPRSRRRDAFDPDLFNRANRSSANPGGGD